MDPPPQKKLFLIVLRIDLSVKTLLNCKQVQKWKKKKIRKYFYHETTQGAVQLIIVDYNCKLALAVNYSVLLGKLFWSLMYRILFLNLVIILLFISFSQISEEKW